MACAHGAQFANPRDEVHELANLVDMRLSLMTDVARWKYTHAFPVRDPGREAAVLEGVQKQANELGLESTAVREFFRVQIEAASELEEQEILRLQTGDPVGEVKDLARELRPRLDAIGKQMMASIYLIASDLRQPAQDSQYSLAGEFERAGLSAQESKEVESILMRMRLQHPPSLAAIKEAGVLRIATTGDYAPFSAMDGDSLVGTDIESVAAFAESLHLKPHFMHTTWPTLLNDFSRNEFDIAVGGISITPERSAVAKFTAAYHHGGKTPIVRCGTEKAFNTLEQIDLPNVRVIVNPGGTNEQFVKQRLHRARVTVFPDNTKIFQEIVAGRADVMVTDDAEVDLQVSRNPALCRATAATFTISDKAWMLIEEPDLLNLANAWITSHATR